MNALVAAATRIGTPHSEFSTGTMTMPPPMPMSVASMPAAVETIAAIGRRTTGTRRSHALVEEAPPSTPVSVTPLLMLRLSSRVSISAAIPPC